MANWKAEISGWTPAQLSDKLLASMEEHLSSTQQTATQADTDQFTAMMAAVTSLCTALDPGGDRLVSVMLQGNQEGTSIGCSISLQIR